MKKTIIMAVAVCLTMTACEKAIEVPDGEASGVVEEPLKTKKFTFTMKGDFSDDWKTTRGYLAADGRDMTDVWVLDYMNGQLVQQVHQGDNTAEDFGKPVMNLAYGGHHVYFVASRGLTPTLNVGAQSITWASVRDTYWKDYEVTVVNTSNGNRAVTLERVVAKLKLTLNDEIPAGAATLTCTPGTWYYGLNYRTGEPCGASNGQEIGINIPAIYVGTSGQLAASVFTVSGADEWTTDVSVAVKDGNGTSLGSAAIADVPMLRNRSTEYSGNLFSGVGNMVVSINGDWVSPYIGTW